MSTAEILAELPRLSLAELSQVQAKLTELVDSVGPLSPGGSRPEHPAIGIWKDRADLPQDAVEASESLRTRMMGRTDALD